MSIGLNKTDDINFYTKISPSLDYSHLFIQSFKEKFPDVFF